MNYETWLKQVPKSIKQDAVWNFVAYSKALLLFDLVWQDCDRLKADTRSKVLINQLIRSTDSISANIDEGYGRGINRKEYIQYLRIALGSARETRSRYFKLRHMFPQTVIQHRMSLCDEIIALLITTINQHKT